ncbi:hypothetical protein [Microbacterium maritypicum]|uniref:Uncharacterized protein n=1 Tax=Microbacterium maritypicum TaxID=33918 RepID=A0AAJ5VAV1_MICMQ|nr:hypothetical protein [Microbacterium liquefaciens]WEF20847.1 hypothetical protein PWF71_16390 [Microbacterium liquefaciens]
MFRSLRFACAGRLERSEMMMRLIGMIGLTLLLIFAIGAADYCSADVAAASTSAGSSLEADVAGSDATSAGSAGMVTQFATGVAQADPVTGAVLCVLGVLCGLVAAVMLYRLLGRATAVVAESGLAHSRTSAISKPDALRRTSLTLATLSISRT